MNIRPFNPTGTEYEALVSAFNQVWPDIPTTVEATRYSYENRDPQYLHQRVVVEDASGELIAAGDYFETSWMHVPGKYAVEMDIVPGHEQAVMQPLYDYMLAKLAQRDPKPEKLMSFSREDKTQIIDFLTGHGFEQVMREPRSAQDVTEVDFARYGGLEEKLAREGIEIYTLPELQQRDPDWAAKYHELEWQIDQDVPSPDPATKQSFEQFQKRFNHPNFRANGHFIAVDKENGNQYVGISTIWLALPSTERVEVGLTGVLRSHRRRGIATALKARTAAFARDIGARYIETENEENNPMYELNLHLGFKPLPAWLEFSKSIGEETSEQKEAELAMGD